MFNALKLYTIHTKQGSDATLDKPIFIREGFNFFAFVFTFFWALYQRLWGFALVFFLANVGIVFAIRFGLLNDVSATIVQIALQVMAGFQANDFLRAKLSKKGYIFQDITSGDSLLRAEQRYFDRLVARA